MRSFIHIAIGLIIAGLVSCQKVIDIPLKEAERLYVIEGNITDEDSCKVLVSRTTSFSDSNGFNGISGALVRIAINGGTPVTLNETKRGVYESSSISGIPGTRYDLTVSINGQDFSATSTMPQKVNMDSLYITERLGFDGKRRKVATVQFQDPPGLGNSYRFVRYIDEVRDNRILLRDDKLSDGRLIRNDLRGALERGDTVRVQMLCIEPQVYKYWFTLDQNARGDDNSPAPANPISNINGGALGYFSAHTVQERTLFVR